MDFNQLQIRGKKPEREVIKKEKNIVVLTEQLDKNRFKITVHNKLLQKEIERINTYGDKLSIRLKQIEKYYKPSNIIFIGADGVK